MPYYNFIWDEDSEQHVAEHGITIEEFEAVVSNPESTGTSRSTGRPMAFGYTDDGREIACIYEVEDGFDVFPVTAFEV